MAIMERLGDIILNQIKVVRGDELLFMESVGACISWHCRRHGLVRPEIVRGDGKDYRICWQCYNESDDTPDNVTGPVRCSPPDSGRTILCVSDFDDG